MGNKAFYLLILTVVVPWGSTLPSRGMPMTLQGNQSGHDDVNAFLSKISDAKPCKWNVTGPFSDVFNLSISPNPPRRTSIGYGALSLYFKEDILSISGDVHVELEGSSLKYDLEGLFCGYPKRTFFCPGKKGETHRFEREFDLSIIPRGVYSAVANAYDQNDRLLLKMTMNNCTIN